LTRPPPAHARERVCQREADGQAPQDLEQRLPGHDVHAVGPDHLVDQLVEAARDLGVERGHGRPGLVGRVGVVGEVQRQLRIGQELGLPVERPDHVGERVEPGSERVPADRRVVEGGHELARRRLEDLDEQGLAGAEVVLDDAPRHARPLGDAVGAGPVEALVEDAVDRGLDHAGASVGSRLHGRRHRSRTEGSQ